LLKNNPRPNVEGKSGSLSFASLILFNITIPGEDMSWLSSL
jgi:hypothetical protein